MTLSVSLSLYHFADLQLFPCMLAFDIYVYIFASAQNALQTSCVRTRLMLYIMCVDCLCRHKQERCNDPALAMHITISATSLLCDVSYAVDWALKIKTNNNNDNNNNNNNNSNNNNITRRTSLTNIHSFSMTDCLLHW